MPNSVPFYWLQSHFGDALLLVVVSVGAGDSNESSVGSAHFSVYIHH